MLILDRRRTFLVCFWTLPDFFCKKKKTLAYRIHLFFLPLPKAQKHLRKNRLLHSSILNSRDPSSIVARSSRDAQSQHEVTTIQQSVRMFRAETVAVALRQNS